MDHSIGLQHDCGAMATGVSPASSCTEVAGLGLTGIIILAVMVLGLALVGYLLWRRMRNRAE